MSSIVMENVFIDFPILQQDQRSLKRILSAPLATSRFRLDDRSKMIVRGLRDINLNLKDGDRVGVIGLNGAGKSTLMRVMAGIYPPTSGSVEVKGRVGALLTVGLGLRDDVSGYKNIDFCLLLFGVSVDEIPEKREEIVEFAELGDFIHLHVGAYSTGMRTRLAFAIATAIDPEILVLDEVFGAGDATFLKKAHDRMHDLIHKARIFVFASHAPGLLEQFCDKGLFLDGGAIKAFGDLREVTEAYEEAIRDRT
ncbi:ABC transporter ATP-binding protein [Microvirga antarctica]|uniref:ABC transporter ATP-binding protein n=1 Tax=Microvirga antarctica TaxID=2819233 RepID=UPI001B3155FB|nr:ABC transporter ATP-binding protein [Microvirga antarctica]